MAALQSRMKTESLDSFGILQQQLSLLQQQKLRQGSPNSTVAAGGTSCTTVEASAAVQPTSDSVQSSMAAVATLHAQLQLQQQQQLATQLTTLQHQLMMLQGLPGLMPQSSQSASAIQLGALSYKVSLFVVYFDDSDVCLYC